MKLLHGVSARAKHGIKLDAVSLDADVGVVAIVGAPRDGVTLLFDVIDGTARPAAGQLFAPAKIARVTLDAPLPEALRVREICALAAKLRGDAPGQPLARLGLESLASRRAGSLTHDERRAVALAIALASSAELILVEEPLVGVAASATRLVVDAIRERAKTACVLAATASPRDATRLGDRIAVLLDGRLTPIEESNVVSRDAGSLRLVVASTQKEGAAALIGALGRDAAVERVESTSYAGGGAALLVHGPDLAALAMAVTRAVASARVDVDVVEPSVLPLDAIRAAILREQSSHA